MELERAGAEHYRALARRVQEPAHGILSLLAADGMAHHRALETMLARPELAAQFDAPAVLRRRIVALPALPADALEDDVLDYAEVREHLAFDMYDRMANLSEPGELRELIVQLRNRKREREQEVRRCGAALFLIF
jgi:rubrerythrin